MSPLAPTEGSARAVRPVLRTDTAGTIRRGVLVLALGLGSFAAWAALAPLDEGVPAPATVVVDSKRKSLQHQTGGVVAAVTVREGQAVQAGQVLLRLDDGPARAAFETVRQRHLAARAQEARLLAEQSGAPAIVFPPDLLAVRNDPLVAQHLEAQQQLFRSRRAAQATEQAALAQTLAAETATLDGLRAQARVSELELAGLRDLASQGYAPLNRQWEKERAQIELQAGIARSQRAQAEIRLRQQQRAQEVRKEVDAQLAELRQSLAADAEKLAAASAELARTELRAPVSGMVVGLTMQTVGGVITPGARVLDVVPQDERLLLEARLPPHLISQVRPGQAASVRFHGFTQDPQRVVDATVETVSADALPDPAGGTFYLARVAVTPAGLAQLGSHPLQAGMPADVVVRTGERSLLTYLLAPLLRRLGGALKEA
mgnify:CR=1 FL=1